jgi:hypothetical protein
MVEGLVIVQTVAKKKLYRGSGHVSKLGEGQQNQSLSGCKLKSTKRQDKTMNKYTQAICNNRVDKRASGKERRIFV